LYISEREKLKCEKKIERKKHELIPFNRLVGAEEMVAGNWNPRNKSMAFYT
jgi:hypothetical protein